MIYRTSHADASLASSLDPDSFRRAATAHSVRPVARREIIDHAVACWHCSKRLQACTPEGKPSSRRSTQSPHYKGAVLAWIAEIDGYPRRLHATCAEELGFKAERP